MSKKKKPHNTSQNSIECYKQIRKEGLPERESAVILRLLSENQPASNRQLMVLSKLERGNVCRCLKDFERVGKVRVSFSEKCATTGRKVGFYSIVG